MPNPAIVANTPANPSVPYDVHGPNEAPPNTPMSPTFAERDDDLAAIRLPADRAYIKNDALTLYATVNRENLTGSINRYVNHILSQPDSVYSPAQKEWAQEVLEYSSSQKFNQSFEKFLGQYQNLTWNDALKLEAEIRQAEGYVRSLERLIPREQLKSGMTMDERFMRGSARVARESQLELKRSPLGQHFVDLPDNWKIRVVDGDGNPVNSEAFSIDISGGRRRHYITGVNADSYIEIKNESALGTFESFVTKVESVGTNGGFRLAEAIGSLGVVDPNPTAVAATTVSYSPPPTAARPPDTTTPPAAPVSTSESAAAVDPFAQTAVSDPAATSTPTAAVDPATHKQQIHSAASATAQDCVTNNAQSGMYPISGAVIPEDVTLRNQVVAPFSVTVSSTESAAVFPRLFKEGTKTVSGILFALQSDLLKSFQAIRNTEHREAVSAAYAAVFAGTAEIEKWSDTPATGNQPHPYQWSLRSDGSICVRNASDAREASIYGATFSDTIDPLTGEVRSQLGWRGPVKAVRAADGRYYPEKKS